jgi:hypothetical protein
MVLPTADEISARLYAVAEARAKQIGVDFGEGAGSELKTLARKGAERILAEAKNKPSEHAEDYVRGAARVGSEAMATFVDEMAIGRLKIQGYIDTHPDSIGDETFRWAKSILCPLWPIC